MIYVRNKIKKTQSLKFFAETLTQNLIVNQFNYYYNKPEINFNALFKTLHLLLLKQDRRH